MPTIYLITGCNGARKVREENRRLGLPLISGKNGKVVAKPA